MNKIHEYVCIKVSKQERKEIIQQYDDWCKNGEIGEGVLRFHAKELSDYLYGENAAYGPPVTTQMKELYVACCRFYANLYLSKK